jgi:hypothetical protein
VVEVEPILALVQGVLAAQEAVASVVEMLIPAIHLLRLVEMVLQILEAAAVDLEQMKGLVGLAL